MCPSFKRVDDYVMKNKQILVIDDEQEIRALLSRFLMKNGFLVLSAGTLEEGRRLFNQSKPELVFLDINLPDGNGLLELKHINSGKLKHKVIMMSAFDHNEVKMEAIQYGALDFLSKPFNIERLNQVVRNQLINSNNTK